MRPHALNLSFTLENIVRGNPMLAAVLVLLCCWGVWGLLGLWRLYRSFREVTPRHEKTDEANDR